MGPPDAVYEMGTFMHACEGELVVESTNAKVPYFNAPIYLENKTSIGKVDEILGPINQLMFTVKPAEGIVANSFRAGDKLYIGGDKLLPMQRFLPQPKAPPTLYRVKKQGGGRGGGRGDMRGRGRGFAKGAPRGGGRGGFQSRGGPPRGRGGPPRGRGGFGRGRG